MSELDWELSQTLLAVDGLGFRCAAVLPPVLQGTDGEEIMTETSMDESSTTSSWYRLITGSQGGQLVEYSIPSGSIQVLDQNQHNDAVTAIVASDFHTGEIYVTACKDGMIRIFHSTTHHLLLRWQAHSKPVTSLAFCDEKERYLVSGSWDGSAKVWNIGTLIHNTVNGAELSPSNLAPPLIAELPNHENSVAVDSIGTSLSNGQEVLHIVTGSAGVAQGNVIRNHTTRVWNVNVITGEARVVHSVANDHEGPIRDIQFVSSATSPFLTTCSNDGTVRVRDPNSGMLQAVLAFSYEPHPPMLLSMTHVSTESLDSKLPSTTIVASAESGHVVFWDFSELSRSTIRQPQVIQHSDCVWNVLKLPNQDVASCCQDGAIRIFTRSLDRVADAEERQRFLESVSKAMSASQSGPSSDEVSKLHPWHSAFEKRGTSEGQVHLFNKNGIAIAAQWSMDSLTWIEVGEVTGRPSSGGAGDGHLDGVPYDHVLPIEIEQTNGQVSTLQIGCNTGENPFTAAQRFIDKHMLPQSYLQQIADYITQRIGRQPTVLGMSSPSAQVSVAFTGDPIVQYEYICPKAYKAFDLPEKSAAITLEKMRNKIVEFGCNDEEVIKTLMATLLATSRYHASKVSDLELSALLSMLNKFSTSQSFPAVDLCRLTVLHPDASKIDRLQFWLDVVQRVVILCQANISSTDENGGASISAVPMLSLRLFCNALKGGQGSREAVVLQIHDVLNCGIMHASSTNKNIRLSVATLLFNVCYYLQLQPRDDPKYDVWIPSIVAFVMEIVNAKVPYETEALVRTLIGMGNIARISAVAKSALNADYLASKVEPMASSHGEVAKAVAKEVYSVLM